MPNVLTTNQGAGANFQVVTETGTIQLGVSTVSSGGSVDATGVTYTPGVSANWSPAPTQVAQALDQLAAFRVQGAIVDAYTASVPGNWSPAPSFVQGALD